MLRFALPGLPDLVRRCAEHGEVTRLPAAEWLLARARPAASAVSPWRDWVLSGSGLGPDVLAHFPAGPSTLALQTGRQPVGSWARAEPVHLLTAIDHLQLASPTPLPLDPEESEALLATLNQHFVDSGFVFRGTSQSSWLCECPAGPAWESVEPSSVVGRNLRDLLPTGSGALRMRAVMNEVQMLLHGHPVNQRRGLVGRPAVNSVWLWGHGAAAVPEGVARGILLTDDEWLAGLWRLHRGIVRHVQDLSDTLGQDGAEVRVAIAAPAASGSEVEALRRMERCVFAPARAALAAGRASSVSLHTGSVALEIPAAARWCFWRHPRPLAEVLA